MASSAIRSVCVYCGSAAGAGDAFGDIISDYGRFLADNRITLIYGGSRFGLMGRLADGCLAAGGEVVGVMPQHRVSLELAHSGLSELIVVGSMHERKAEMARRAAAFVAFPGGLGTLDELFEIMTWRQLGIHSKPILIANLNGYWDETLSQIRRMHSLAFCTDASTEFIEVCLTAAAVSSATLVSVNDQVAGFSGP